MSNHADGNLRCSCGETDSSKFGINRSRRSGYQSQCLECKKKSQKKWYSKNAERHKSNVRRRNQARIEENKTRLLQFLQSHSCVDCGESDPVVLEFDHVSGKKKASISQMVTTDAYSWASIERELAKCEIRCANCHRRRTAEKQSWYKFFAHVGDELK